MIKRVPATAERVRSAVAGVLLATKLASWAIVAAHLSTLLY
ncbi:MAG: hypothetical protein OT477_17465 [Chloroflexi bacterium]|nr:hypothetical protein [Chloroflexota bacterium]